MLIIGFGCKAQVGKDTASIYLENKYSAYAKRVAFADKIKEEATSLFNLTKKQLHGPQEFKEAVDPRYNMSAREILQQLGKKMREIYPSIWRNFVFDVTIPELQKQGYDLFAISDVRYPNEVDKIHEAGGIVVNILRDGAGVTVGKYHESEHALEDYEGFDFTIKNNGTFGEFYKEVDRVLEAANYGREERQH